MSAGAAESVIEAEATEIPDEDAEITTAETGVVLHSDPAPASREVLMPLDADQVVRGMESYQALLPRLLAATDYQGTGDDAFVKKSGWRKIGRAFNLSVPIVSLSVERDAAGRPVRAECIARAIAPNGQVHDGDGYCSVDEFTGKRADNVKLENDLRATATTRAKNRAIADLVGMGEVSAEEASPSGGASPSLKLASDQEQKAAKKALGRLVPDSNRALHIYSAAFHAFGDQIPQAFAHALIAIAPMPQAGAGETQPETSDFEAAPKPEPVEESGL